MEDERRLVDAVLARESGAFERLVDLHQTLVWHLLFRMARNPEDTRDLSQLVFIRVHQRLHQFRFESALGTWIGRIAYSIGMRHLEKHREREVELTDAHLEQAALDIGAGEYDLELACADEELIDLMDREIAALPSLPRTLISLFHLQELGIAQIAAIVDMPVGTVKSHLFRARLKLRLRLTQVIGERM